MRAPFISALGLAAGIALIDAVAADPARISVNSPSAVEGDGPQPALLEFTISRAGETGSTVTLEYRTDDGTAVAPGDYTGVPPSRLTLAAGENLAVIPVTIHGDTDDEGDEFLYLRLTGIISVLGAPANFAAASSLGAGGAPAAVVTADVNGDGRPDLVIANAGSDRVTVRLNTTVAGAALATFATPVSFPVGDNPRSLAVVEVNGDGRPDLAVANSGSDTVSVLLNTTAPGAEEPGYADAGHFATGADPRAVATADLNGDGLGDLAVANADSGTLSVLLNTTAAGAELPSYADASELATGSDPRAVIALDVNGDGRADLAVARAGADSVTVLLNTTAAGAAPVTTTDAISFPTGSTPRSLTGTDANRDGLPDLAVANAGSNTVSVLLNSTAAGAEFPSFAPAAEFAAGSAPGSLTAVDLDGDGRADLAVADTGDDGVSVLLNTTAAGASPATYADASRFAAAGDTGAIAAADVNGDGLPDLVVANPGSGTVSVLLNRPAVIDTSEGTGTLRNDDTDTTPEAFSFIDQTGVALNRPITSNEVTITGISTAVPITVTGGSYSIGCTNKFTTARGTIGNGRSVCVRHTSSRDFGAETRTLLTVGGVSGTFTSTTLGPDGAPDPFTFTDVGDALLNSVQISNSVTLGGFDTAVAVNVTGGEYSLGCTDSFTAAAGSAPPGTTVCVRHVSSAQHGIATHTTLTAGGVSDTFTSRTPGQQDFSKTGAPGPLDAWLGLLAALARRRAHAKNPSARLPWRTDSP